MSTPSDDLPPLKKALLAVQQLKAKVADLTSGPVAVVGAGLRFPGGARDLGSYWDLLERGADAVREVPPDRWDADAWTDPDPAAPGKMTTRHAGFLDEVATFDAAFFGISPREALELDPAQRLLLEVSWEALESAGIAPDRLDRSPTGVYVGLGLSDYGRRHFLGPDPTRMTAYSGTGAFLSVAAGRIAYTLGLQGPAMTVDTACSSSLVSIHLAVDALRRGEVDLALAGGANVICAPEPSVYFSKLGATSRDGRCKTFDASADGYGRGEGAAVVALKRLADAIAAGDPILAVIRGTAVNQDGRSNGLTAPNGAAQQAVVRKALENAGLRPEDVGYVEAHGTGTPLGDPIEVDALRAVFGDHPLMLGSVKTNFGHLETAAGVAGLLKLALALDRGRIPAHLHLRELNPRIRLGAFEVPTSATDWRERHVGGVSSFGLSGTNAHLVLERAPARVATPTEARPVEIVPLSARSAEQLSAAAARWAEVEAPLADVAHTAAVGRAALPVRLAVVGRDRGEVAERLRAAARGEDVPGLVRAEARGTLAPPVVFLFTGQGAQHTGMGQRLHATEPVFRDALDRCFAAIDPILGASTADVLWSPGRSLDDTAFTQPALFALEVALAAFWRAMGVEPDAMAGHSIGEIAAAHVAGVLSLDDAARLVVERGRLMGSLPREGAMVAVMAPEADVRSALAGHADVDVSGVNHPTETVISGRASSVDAVARAFEGRGTKVRRLVVSHAFHSPLMEPVLDAFEAVARTLTFAPPTLPVISNLDGQHAGERLRDPAYWRRHLRSAVRFADGMETLLAGGHALFLELGPRPVLSGMGARCAEGRQATFLPSLHPDRDDADQVAETAAALWARGVPVDLGARHPDGRRTALPTTPWLGERYWLEPVPAGGADPYADQVLEVAWRPAPVERRRVSGRWVVQGDPALARALAERGATVSEAWVPDPDGVVLAPADGDPAALAWAAADLARRVAGAGSFARLHLVARADSPATAVLRGVGRVLALEHPDRWGGFVEIQTTRSQGESRSGSPDDVLDAVLATDGEDLVCVRDGQRRVARLQRSRKALAGGSLRLDGAVLVTGGFGALGRRIATWLADQGARHLVLAGRSGASSVEAVALLDALRARGVRVDEARVDTASVAALREVVGDLDLAGVVHAAGTSDDGPLLSQSSERFAAVIRPKAAGAVALHEATAGRELGFFVLVSSAAGLLGVPGQASYAAANAFLDAFARWRRAQGLPAVSIAFGPWDGEGMAARVPAGVRAGWAAEGVRPIDADDALAVLGRAATGAQPEVLVAPFEWAAWRRTRPAATHLADELVAEVPVAAAAAPATTALLDALRKAPAGARDGMLADHVQQVASRVLGFAADRRIGTADGFFDRGMDSLMAMDLRDRLQTALGVALSPTVAFDHPNVKALARHLLGKVALAADAVVAVAVAVASHEPIAVVGAACRMPGGASDLDALWALFEGGVDAVTEVPRDRFDVDRWYDPVPGTPGKLSSRWGGFVDGIELFDPQHFGISPREATSLDPQQRMLLETTWHALEDAAIAPTSLRDTRTGVYVGIGHSEYWHRFDPTTDEVDAYAGTGNETSFAAGRVSYVLGLQGPSMSVNTACSSSLVSIHMAVRALREGQCDLAVAGGVNAIVGPETTIWMSMLQALAPDGRCKAFDARADGYVRSEGCGTVVLKRLSDALRDDDRVYAVIRGSAVNHDGASSGLTVPNGLAQEQVIRAALADAGVDPHDVGFVECHGTGTKLGDPIEVRALGNVLAAGRTTALHLGAAKANLGHLEAGAGIVGFLRAMLAVHRGTVPPIANLGDPNPALPLDEFPAVTLPRAPVAWEGRRVAGVSSFGISGTNAHVVLEAPPARSGIDRTTARPLALLAVSGRTPEQADAQAAAVLVRLERDPLPLADLAVTLAAGRAHLRHRAVVLAGDLEAAKAGLRRPAIRGEAQDAPRVVFLCTGAGPQAFGMGRALYDADPVFRAALDEACAAADPWLDRPLFEVIHPADPQQSPLHDLAYTQPAMFALEWATAAVWRSWGVQPAAVIGHSTGQYVAATLAGVFDLPTGMRLMAERARLMSDEPKVGEMVACFASEERVRGYLAGHAAEVDVAAVNGPAEAVISGRREVVDAIAKRIEADGIEIRRLNISHAAHSPLMEPILDRFEARVRETAIAAPRIPLVENVRGEVAGDEVTDPRYWREHMRRGVRFHAGMRTLVAHGYRVFVELGNHPVLAGAGARCVEDVPDAVFLPSLRRDVPDWTQLLDTAGRLHALGAELDWAAFFRHAPGQRVGLPGLPFQRKKYWVDRRDRASARVVGADWVYGERWEAVRPNVEAQGARGDRPIVVLADAGGIGELLASRQKRRAVVVRPGETFAADGDRYTIDPAEPAHLDRLLAEVAPAHVVDLWPLDAREPEAPVRSALHLLQAAARNGSPHVWLVTRGAVAVGTEAPDLAQAPLVGLGTTAAVELELPVVRVDLDPAGKGDVMHLELVLNTGLREDQLAIRGGKHLARRIARLPAEGAPAPAIRADGAYLVTGGLGAIGLHVAAWLRAQGAGRIVLVGRTARGPVPDGTTFATADVAEPAHVERLVAEHGPFAGVFHAAGVLADGALLTQSWSAFPAVWRPKVAGAWNLHRACPDAELFVLFSSAASFLGSAGQGAYAAANAALDALAHVRRAEGRHAVSLCWGPWADGGLATASSRAWERGGVAPLAPTQAVAVMAQRLGGPEPACAIVALDWKRWPASLPRVPALVAGLVEVDEAPAARRTLAGELRAAPPAERRERLAAAVVAEVAAILGMEPGEVDRRVGFFDAGMDSLMAVDLANRLRRRLERALPATAAFDHPSVDVLVDWLLPTLDLGTATAVAAAERRIDLDEPIAVVGLSCRMPGGANDPEAFWELLRSARDPMVDVPPTRWDLSEWYDPTPGRPGKMYVRQAGFVDDALVHGFDPEFFGISPREAETLDPQQRMLLEVSYEALERAGLTTAKLQHSRTGVFVGVGDSGFLQRFQEPGGPLYLDQYAGTGNLAAFVSGRVAYVLGLHGPNFALNTACSSSLVALHLACQALRCGEAEVALAGGVHLMLSPENFVYVSQIKALAADGRCKTFDASANGYGRAEGCGVVALKRLSDARRDGDPVLAVIRGTACGHDGPSSGLTVPYGPAQVQVLSDAVARSGLDPLDVSYVEAHGTGTVLGDPIEVHAIEEVYCRGRDATNPLRLGAVKSNVGHLEVAAGAASMVKMVLALQHRELPPNLHFHEPNPDLDLQANALEVPTAPTPWTSPRGTLRAGISAFGLAGTNVHVVVEEAPPARAVEATDDAPERPAHLLVLSARSDGALDALAERYAAALEGGADVADVAHSAATTRIAYERRLTLAAPDAATMAARLREGSLATRGEAAGRAPKVVFLFSGQGSQYTGMGRALYAAWPPFRQTVDLCAERVPGLLDALFGENEPAGQGRVDDTTWTQPCLFVLEVALAELWKSWGVEPAAVLGHSIGQISAACVAGALSIEDGLRLVVERGRLMGALPREGAMYAAFTDEATVREALVPHGDEVGIAAINNPGECTISGRTDAVRAVAEALKAEGIDGRELTVSHAFHSPLMDPMLAPFEAVAASVAWRPARIPVVCNLTGGFATDAQLSSPAYWRDLVRSPVRFAAGLQTLEDAGHEVFVELGPHTALLGMGRRTLAGRHLAWLPSLQRGEDAHERILPSLGALWVRGVAVDWKGFDAHWTRRRVQLPTYPFQRRRIWPDREEFPGRRAQAAAWLVAPTWEERAAEPGELGPWWVVGADAQPLRDALAARARVTADPDEARAVAVVVSAVADGIGADPVAPARAVLEAVRAVSGRSTAGSLPGSRGVRLAIVTRGASGASPLAATAWGLGRVVRVEEPTLRTVLVDLDPDEPVTAAVDALLAGDDETEVRVSGGRRLVARLDRVAFDAGPPALGGGAVLVTGGLAGLGLAAAEWLADHGAEALVLVARSAPKPEAEAAIERMRAKGCAVTVERGDVALAADVERIVRGHALVGIVHAAGVLADMALSRLDDAAFRATFGPKVLGTWNLHRATEGLDLRFFVLFAAGAGLMGAPGQGNYAAANAFQDAFARWRRAKGLPAVAIDWGAWAEVGMAARMGDSIAARQAEEGIGRIPLRAGLDAMGRLLAHGQAQVGVLPVDWEKFVAVFHRGQRPPLLERLATGRPTPAAGPVVAPSADGPALLASLRGQPRAAWDGLADDFVHAQAQRILRIERSRALDRDKPLLDLGLDSLLAVELKNAIMDGGVDIAVARVMTGPSIRQIGQMVVAAVDDQGLAIGPEPGAAAAVVRLVEVVEPPINPIVSHLGVFLLGVITTIVLYVGSALLVGTQEPGPADPDGVEAPAPAPKAAKPGKSKRP